MTEAGARRNRIMLRPGPGEAGPISLHGVLG